MDEARQVAHDTVRVVSLARDTVTVRDTVREAVRYGMGDVRDGALAGVAALWVMKKKG